MTDQLIEKLKDSFDEMIVYKNLKKSNFFSSLGLPSFLRDWLLRQFEDEDGEIDMDELSDFIHTYLPKKDNWLSIKNKIINDNARVKLLTKISVDIDIKSQEITFSLPEFGLTNKETLIDPYVWEEVSDELVRSPEVWGIIELGYRPPNTSLKLAGKILLTGFKNFCPYEVELDYYREARNDFDINEWIDILLGAIDYNADGYKEQGHKLAMLKRLLPFVEKRLNLIELAPKGTGKSYIFGHISRQGILVDGGKVTRAKMFYDASRRAPGFIVGNDFVAIDEVKLVTFGDVNEMRSIMQGYMEYGAFNFSGYEGKADAGIVFLGNIDKDRMDIYENMFYELPPLFQESALLDRIHGFIKGWDIPRMNDDLKVEGWALNSEYFCSILHLLREDTSYRAIVDRLIEVPPHSDTRDTEAVKRIATAYLKLLFPNVQHPRDIKYHDFKRYCLRPAVEMRKIVKIQLGILDKEFAGKDIPAFDVVRFEEEE